MRRVVMVIFEGVQPLDMTGPAEVTASTDALGPAIAGARTNLARVEIEGLACRAGLSLRTLHRRCAEDLQTTPAKLLDKLRVEYARTLLAPGPRPAKQLAVECGFGNSTRMKRAFERELGMGPREYRLLHATDCWPPAVATWRKRMVSATAKMQSEWRTGSTRWVARAACR